MESNIMYYFHRELRIEEETLSQVCWKIKRAMIEYTGQKHFH